MNSMMMSAFRDEFTKIADELTPEAREKLPGKDFAVKAKKSNTGKEAYPIPDKQHAASALGFAKMHHDTADIAAVKKKIEAKYPDMLKKGFDLSIMAKAAEAACAKKEKDGNMGQGTYGPSSGSLPGMVGGPAGGTGLAAAGKPMTGGM